MGQKLGNFGSLVDHYERARRAYPKEVFTLLKTYLPKDPRILDLGCGTGISTRQLNSLGKVVGCDPDPIMLCSAREHEMGDITYVRGSAEELPFKDATFDVITAFASFHWFSNKRKALMKLKGF